MGLVCLPVYACGDRWRRKGDASRPGGGGAPWCSSPAVPAEGAQVRVTRLYPLDAHVVTLSRRGRGWHLHKRWWERLAVQQIECQVLLTHAKQGCKVPFSLCDHRSGPILRPLPPCNLPPSLPSPPLPTGVPCSRSMCCSVMAPGPLSRSPLTSQRSPTCTATLSTQGLR